MRTIRSRWALPILLGLSLGLAAGSSPAQPKKPPPPAAAKPPASAAPHAAPPAPRHVPLTPAQQAADAEGLKIIREAGEFERKKKYAEAIELAQKALAVREKALGPDHTSVITTVSYVAELLEHKGEYARAVPLRERVLASREKEKGPDDIDTAFRIEELARTCDRAGDHARAVTLLQRELAIHEKRTPKGELVAMTLNMLGKALVGKRDLDAAQAAFERAIAIYEDSDRPMGPAVGYTLTFLGAVFAEKRQYVKAEQALIRALEIEVKAWGPDHGRVAEALGHLGALYNEMGYFGRAEPLFERLVAIVEHEEGDDSTTLALSLDELANVSTALGDYARAEGLYLRALGIQEKKLPPGHVELAQTKLGLGALHLAVGDVDGAEPLLNAALAVMQKALPKDHADLAEALGAVADLRFKKGDPEGAEGWLTRALAVESSHLGQDDPKIAVYQTRLGRFAAARGKRADAEQLFTQALSAREKVFGKDHPLCASSLRDIAALKLQAGDLAGAEPLYQRALATAEKGLGKDHGDVAAALSGLASIDLARGNVAAAVAHQGRAIDIEEHNLGLILEVGSEAQKRSFMATLEGSTNLTVSLHARTAPKDAAAARLSLLAILQRKGRVLDVMADALAVIRRRLPEADRPFLTQLAAARGAYAAAVLRGPGATPLDEHLLSLGRFQQEIRRIEEKMSAASATFLEQETPVTIERVQAALPEDAALVEYFVYQPFVPPTAGAPPPSEPARLVAYTLRASGQIRFVDLGPVTAVESAVARFRKSLAAASSTDTRALGRALDEIVMRPVRGILDGATRVLLSPDGALNIIPFDALVDEGDQLLVQRFDFTYLTSGRDLLRRSLRSAARAEPLVFANPAFGRPAGAPPAATSRTTKRSVSLRDAVFPALPGTASEARALSKILPNVDVRVDVDATETALKKAAAPRILHIATHGFFLPDQDGPTRARTDAAGRSLTAAEGAEIGAVENPLLRSGLALAGANGLKSGDDDGILTALEASGLDLDGTELVVLSACETGLGDVMNGDGVYGLRRALFIAGAATEVTSLWKVDDQATRDLMVEYYQKLLHGGARSASLHEVQRSLLGRKATAHPYFWASFVVSGDPSPLRLAGAPAPAPAVPKVAPGARGCGCEVGGERGSAGGAVLLAALIGCLGRRRRR